MSSSSSHMMKTTRRGRPFVKDTHDLFATLMVSLKLEPHRNFFKVYPNSFTTDEACSNLASLKFSQSNRSADPKDPSRIITTTTTTTFSMTREMAKSICAHFLEAHVIENATDLQNTSFKDRGIYMLTPKGLHILERFIAKNGIGAEHLMPIFGGQPICMKMLHLERRSGDDEIMINKGVMDVLFRRFTGTHPNATSLSDDELQNDYYRRWYNKPNSATEQGAGGEAELDRSHGMPVHKVYNAELKRDEYHFSAIPACLWLVDYTTCVGLDEASEVAAHFVRYGLVTLVSDKGKIKDGNVIANVKAGGAGGGAGAVMQEAEFRATDKAIYKITKEGMILARWIAGPSATANTTTPAPNSSKVSLATETSGKTGSPLTLPRSNSSGSKETLKEKSTSGATGGSARVRELRDKNGELNMSETDGEHHAKDSHAARLNQILDEPALRSLFREFLRTNFCEENLSFWLDVNEFRRRFSTTSSAVAGPAGPGVAGKKGGQGLAAMEKHQQDLINMAFVIYNTYLAPASPCELNIDHSLRGELIQYMTQVTSDKDAGIKGHIEPGVGNTLHASQLQTMLKLYDKIQTYTFRLMATDSVPKFVKTERFMTLARSLIDMDADVSGMTTRAANLHLERAGMAAGMDEIQPSPTKAYMTISQAANEKEAAIRDRRVGGL